MKLVFPARRIGAALVLVIFAETLARGQDAAPAQPAPPARATVSFTLEFPQARPEHAAITLDASGKSQYQSSGPLFSSNSEDDTYSAEFTLSAAGRDRIFALAQHLDYFHGDFDYKRTRIAFTGRKTLRYADAQRDSSTAYNWSENTAVQELTRIFQDIINTQEAGRRIRFLHRFDPLGLDAELKTDEEMAKSGSLGELQSIAAVLRQIADDPGVVNAARQRARRLLSRAGVAASLQTSSR